MLTMSIRNHGMNFESPRKAIEFLVMLANITDVSCPSTQRQLLAKTLAPQVQAMAITKYPVETIVKLSVFQRELLYSTDVNHVEEWNLVPPFVYYGDSEGMPKGVDFNGEHTVWHLNTETDTTLLQSLIDYKMVSARFND